MHSKFISEEAAAVVFFATVKWRHIQDIRNAMLKL